MTPSLTITRLDHAEGLPLPSYQTDGAAGLDLSAAIATDQPVTIAPRERAVLPTGFIMAIPAGFEGQVRPRSGLAARSGVTVLNAPGTIDSDYRGESLVILINLSDAPVTITRGDRIAQLVIAPVHQVAIAERKDLDETERGDGGLGSTGR